LAGDLGLGVALGEQLGRPQPTGLEPVAFFLCRRAARDSWHARILTRPAAKLQLHLYPQPDTQGPFTKAKVSKWTDQAVM
jgi:hypothetical protein